MALNPWSHDNPFTPGTLIRADEMNAALQGIAASLDEFATDLTNFVVRLPNNFAGENQIPDQTVTERLLYINASGDMGFYSLAQFNAGIQQVEQDKITVEGYKNTASTKAGEASASASAAAGSSSTASNHANTANQHRLKAAQWASENEDVAVETGLYSAYHYMKKTQALYNQTAADFVTQAQFDSLQLNYDGHSHSWSQITSKPTTFTPSAHGHGWTEITGKPATATRWPKWSEITDAPSELPPEDHGHLWSQISGVPVYTQRWPSFSEVTGKPASYPPSSHTHPWSEVTGKPTTFTPSSHTHPWSQITGKPSSYTPSAHSHSISEVSGLSAELAAGASKGAYNNSNQTVTRLGRVTEVCIANTTNITKTLNNAAFTVGDSVKLYKTLADGVLTVALDSGNIQLPDNTLGSSHVLTDAAAVISLFKITSTTWALSIYGG